MLIQWHSDSNNDITDDTLSKGIYHKWSLINLMQSLVSPFSNPVNEHKINSSIIDHLSVLGASKRESQELRILYFLTKDGQTETNHLNIVQVR